MKKYRDIYQEVTDKIIAQMEQGRVPWVKPWNGTKIDSAAMPYNAVSQKPYSGINILLLWDAINENDFGSAGWLTFKQAKALGGTVRRGEKGSRIVYADKFIPKEEREAAKREGRDPNETWYLKTYCVFNLEQCDGLPEDLTGAKVTLSEFQRIEAAEHLMTASGAAIHHSGNKAYYSPVLDAIRMPPRNAFHSPEDYYRTGLHELGHWTGHPARLDRSFGCKKWGDAGYAEEELVAEMTAAFTCATCGIEPTIQHAAYLQSWLRVLKDDKRFIFKAASHASKAADFILKKAAIAETRQAA